MTYGTQCIGTQDFQKGGYMMSDMYVYMPSTCPQTLLVFMAINSVKLILGNHLTGFNLVKERGVGKLPPQQMLQLPPTISRNTVLYYRLEVTTLIAKCCLWSV